MGNTRGRVGVGSFDEMLENDPRRALDYWEKIHAKLTVDIKALNANRYRNPVQERELKDKRLSRRIAANMITRFQQRIPGF